MSLNCNGFEKHLFSGEVIVNIEEQHPLIKCGNDLPWQSMLNIIFPDLQNTERGQWWRGRPLNVRAHLGVYLLQKLYDLTDRQAEYSLRDNAAFQLFCGRGLLKKWHAPDHTKIEAFRSRLSPETQRQLANLITVQAVKLNYANPAKLDVDSTIQEANISPPSQAGMLVKIATLAKRVSLALIEYTGDTTNKYMISLTQIKSLALTYFNEKRKSATQATKVALESLWREVSQQVMPVIIDSYQLIQASSLQCYAHLQRAIEQLQWRAQSFLEDSYLQIFEKAKPSRYICSLHARDVVPFNKKKLNKKVQYGRAYQLGRIEGNFLFVGRCDSLHMPDAQSLPFMVNEHQQLFDNAAIDSIAVDKGYYSHENQSFLVGGGVKDVYLPPPDRTLKAPKLVMDNDTRIKLHNRRAGIEPLIGHTKQGGQMDRSRMKSDRTTLSAGYASVLGFNLRQLKRYAIGVIRLESEEHAKNEQIMPEEISTG